MTLQASNLTEATEAMAVTASSIGLDALQFSKELAAKYGLKSCLTMAVVPLTASADRQSCLPTFKNVHVSVIKTSATILIQFFHHMKNFP